MLVANGACRDGLFIAYQAAAVVTFGAAAALSLMPLSQSPSSSEYGALYHTRIPTRPQEREFPH
jgi:hypothetical protein